MYEIKGNEVHRNGRRVAVYLRPVTQEMVDHLDYLIQAGVIPEDKEQPMTTATKTSAAKKTTKAAAPKEKAKKDGLRKPQVRILAALARNKAALTRSQIAEKAPVDAAACVEYIGSADEAVRKANDVKHFPSLISLGLVKIEQRDVDGTDTILHTITAKGRTELEKAAKAS